MTLVRTKDGAAGSRVGTRYEDDPYTWALEQAALLREGRLERLDAPNLADEIETLTHYLADKLESDLVRVLQHLLKWDHQPNLRSRSWFLSVAEHRRRIDRHLRKAPGLSSVLDELVQDAFQTARNEVLKETHLAPSAITTTCPYGWDAIMAREIPWPEAP